MKHFVLQTIALVFIILLGTWAVFTPGILDSFTSSIANVPGFSQGNQSSNPSTSSNEEMVAKRLNIVDSANAQVKASVEAFIADTKQKKELGLGGRDALGQDEGMLFVYDTPQKLKFWMKGMKFPLDMIWIKGDQIVDLTVNVAAEPGVPDNQLKVYAPVVEVDKVLEVNSGYAQNHHLKVGDKIQIVEQ